MKPSLKNVFLITAIFLMSGITLAQKNTRKPQNPSTFKNALKLNVNYTHNLIDKSNFSVGNFAPAFLFTNKSGYMHEIEFNRLKIDQTEFKQLDNQGTIIAGNRGRQTEIGLRYQFTRNLLRKESKLIPQLGITLLALYTSNNNVPLVTNAYPRRAFYIGGTLGIVPQLRYNFANRVFMDFSIPIDFMDVGFSGQEIENPSIPSRQQKNGGYELDQYLFDEIHVRLGVGIKL